MTPVTVSASDLPEAKAKLEIEVSSDLVEHSIMHAAQHMSEQIKVPGFREGKVPAELALQKLGHDAVFQHAFDESVGIWYAQAIAESEISPIGTPSLAEMPEYVKDEPLKFELEVPVRPHAELGDYEGIEAGKREPVTDESLVDAELEVMRDRFSVLADVDRAAQTGDFVDIDFTGRLDGEEFEGGAGRDYVLELGSDQFIPGFEDQLVGAKAGDSVDVKVRFPDEYQASHLAGKDVVFEVKVNSVKEKKLPELDDEFASENLGYDTITELRDEIRARIAEQAEQEVDREYRWAVVDAVAKLSKIDVPQGHIHSRAHEIWQELSMSLSRRGMDPRMFLQMQGKTEHEFIEGAEEDALTTIRRESTIAAVIEKLDLNVTDEDMIRVIAEDMGEGEEEARKQFDEIRESGSINQLVTEVKGRLAIDHLVEASKPIPIEQAAAREAIWTPDKEQKQQAEQASASGGEGIWTPGS